MGVSYIILNFKQKETRMKNALEDVRREIAIMKKIRHPNLVGLHEVIDNPDEDKIIIGLNSIYKIPIVLDLCDEGQLIEWDEEEERFYFCKSE